MTRSQGKLGDYEILRDLESGGMGTVSLARKRGAGGFEKLFAIKVMRRELRELDAVRQMFLDEAQLLARIAHSAVAQVYDFGEHDGSLYLVMEYVEGVNVRDLIDCAPPPAVSARVVAAACRGLHAAHELSDLAGTPMNVVHRDVSPENLMLTFDGRVKVLDFGIALMRDRRAPATEFGAIKGKPPYLAPEQVTNQTIDRRTDVFAAGIVLHELITGEPVFRGDSVFAVARAIELAPIAPPSQLRGALPDGLDQAVLRALARAPDDRYPTALAMAEEL
ncbi:MAG: serine/threonine-protein kinase, partial [Myxococcota bacterium]